MADRKITRKVRLSRVRNASCYSCALCKTAANICVMGRGKTHAKIMLVGEAPGEAEAKTGKPFMGRAGKFLDLILQDLGMTDMVYITNTVKCRPPDNRKPKPWEVDACNQYLEREIAIIRPAVIVALGRIAGEALLGKDLPSRGKRAFGQVHGPDDPLTIIYTWHPSYVLRTQFDPWTSKADLTKALKTARDLVS